MYSNGVGLAIKNNWFEQDKGGFVVRFDEPDDICINEISNTIIRGNTAKYGVYIKGVTNFNRVIINGSRIGDFGDTTSLYITGAKAYAGIFESNIISIKTALVKV